MGQGFFMSQIHARQFRHLKAMISVYIACVNKHEVRLARATLSCIRFFCKKVVTRYDSDMICQENVF